MSELRPRHQLESGMALLDTFRVLVIQGARQVGKSTFAQMLVKDRPHTMVTLDDPEVRHAASNDPRSLLRLGREGTLVIDEVQREPELLLAIKAAVDTDPRPGRFLLTGSSDLLRLSRTPDSLAGRAVTLDLAGFSQGELSGVREDFAAWARATDNPLQDATEGWSREAYVAALVRGSYPEAQGLNDRTRNVWFDSYLARLLKRDVGDVSRGLSSDRLEAVFRLIAANQGGELVQSRLADTLAMSKSSMAAYLSALQTLYLTNDLKPWRANLTKREVGRHKVSVADSGLALRLAGLRPNSLGSVHQAPAFGMQLEAFVVGELMKQRNWSEEEFELSHFRDRNGLEVDIVIEFTDDKVFLLEVKASETYRGEHTKGIRALAERLGDRFIGGAVLGLDPKRRFLGDRIWGLPISSIWEH